MLLQRCAGVCIVHVCPQVAADFAFIPFGGGPRKCIGDQFAMFEATVAAAMLLRRYTFRLAATPQEVSTHPAEATLCAPMAVLLMQVKQLLPHAAYSPSVHLQLMLWGSTACRQRRTVLHAPSSVPTRPTPSACVLSADRLDAHAVGLLSFQGHRLARLPTYCAWAGDGTANSP